MTAHALPDAFDYVGDVYRPPVEADSIIIQGTIGCSHNKCTFCGAYLRKKFALKNQETLENDLRFAEHYCIRQNRVFILDGNALAMPMQRWIWLLGNIQDRLPWVEGTAAFATGMDIAAKNDDDLRQLRALGLDKLYVGVESGHPKVLESICKGIGPDGLLTHCRRAQDAGFSLSISVVLGVADSLWRESAQLTGKLLTALDPDEIGITMLVPQPGTIFRKEIKKGTAPVPGRDQLLRELRELYLHTDLNGGLFNASHSSSYVSFKARLPREKARGLEYIDQALAGLIPLKANELRRI